MILAVRKSDEKVFEVVGCDAFHPTSWLEDLAGNRFYESDSNLKLVFDTHPLFKDYLGRRS